MASTIAEDHKFWNSKIGKSLIKSYAKEHGGALNPGYKKFLDAYNGGTPIHKESTSVLSTIGSGIKSGLNAAGSALPEALGGTEGKLKRFETGSQEQRDFQNRALQEAWTQFTQQEKPTQTQQMWNDFSKTNPQMSNFLQGVNSLGNVQMQMPEPGENGYTTAGKVAGGLSSVLGTVAPFTGPAAPYLAGGAGLAALAGTGLGMYGQYQQGQDKLSYQKALDEIGGQQNQLNFEPIKQKYIREFEQNTIPSIAERFSALGQNSGAYKQALAQSKAQLMENLAAMEQHANLQNRGMNNQQIQMAMQLLGQQTGDRAQQQQLSQNQQRMGMENRFQQGQLGLGQRREDLARNLQNQARFDALSQIGLQPQTQNMYQAGQPGFLHGLVNQAPSIVGAAAKGYFGQPPI